MPETLIYKPEAHDTPADWDVVFGRIEQLSIPENKHARAEDIARHFSRDVDIEMFGKALHDVLVPDVESMPTNYAMKLRNKSGELTRVLATPDMRAGIYQQAAEYIRQLAEMRRESTDDDAFLARAANIVALAIVQAHAYENGNGRTARVAAELICDGIQNRDDLILLGTERGRIKRETGSSIQSFSQRYESIDKGESDADVMSIAASLDIPLADRTTYFTKANMTFSSTCGF